MSKPRAAVVGDSIVQMLNAAAWAQSFQAERRWRVKWTPTELETLRVTVMIVESIATLATRGKYGRRMVIDIGVQKKLASPESIEEVDALAYLVETIADYFGKDADAGSGRRAIVGCPNAQIGSVTVDPLYSVEDLTNRSQFFGHVAIEVFEATNV